MSLDSGFEIWLDWYDDRLMGQPLDLDLLEKQVNISDELIAQGPKAVNAYLATLDQATHPLNLVRCLFVGNGGAGKTSLIRALHDETVAEGQEKMTAGIEIREWIVGDTEIKARFWDFGGQVMSHSTHQFFLRERCLYILVLDARAEFNANDQAEYWLEHVRAFGKDAPVMLVGNKLDLTAVNLDLRALREKYPNIVDFYPLSCTVKTGSFQSRFDTFRTELITQLQALGIHQIAFTNQQFAVLEEIRKRTPGNAFLEHKEFDALCNEHNIGKDRGLSREDLLGLLDKLGEVIHFPEIPDLTSYVLNPRWLTYGVYTLLYSEAVEKDPCGVLSEAEAITILQAKRVEDEFGNILDYPTNRCSFILAAMEFWNSGDTILNYAIL